MKFNEFLSRHAVFTLEEMNSFLSGRGSCNPNTRKSLLAYYLRKNRIVRMRRGLYTTVALGSNPASSPADMYLVTAKMKPDAVLAYHTALEFHGKSYSLFTKMFYTSASKSLPLKLQFYEIKGIPIPHCLLAKGKEMYGVTFHKRSGVELRVTNLERTFVDVLARPDLAGSWEEIWRSLESVEFFALDKVIEYVLLLENATTAAKVGFFLEQHKEALMVDDVYLNALRNLRPRNPHYLVRGKRKDCKWVKDWNLMIPVEIINKSWGEVL